MHICCNEPEPYLDKKISFTPGPAWQFEEALLAA
jgi:hypothetical protein